MVRLQDIESSFLPNAPTNGTSLRHRLHRPDPLPLPCGSPAGPMGSSTSASRWAGPGGPATSRPSGVPAHPWTTPKWAAGRAEQPCSPARGVRPPQGGANPCPGDPLVLIPVIWPVRTTPGPTPGGGGAGGVCFRASDWVSDLPATPPARQGWAGVAGSGLFEKRCLDFLYFWKKGQDPLTLGYVDTPDWFGVVWRG